MWFLSRSKSFPRDIPKSFFSIRKIPKPYGSWSKGLRLLVWWYVWDLVVTGVEEKWNPDSGEWVVTRNFKKPFLAIKRVQERRWVRDCKWHFPFFLFALFMGWGMLWLFKLMLTLCVVLVIWSAPLGLSSPNTTYNSDFERVFFSPSTRVVFWAPVKFTQEYTGEIYFCYNVI